MNCFGCFTVGVVALTVMPSVQAQEPRLRARLDLATSRSVEQLVDSARKIGLPTEPLVQKALEGQTKGASNERILTAVSTLLQELGQVRAALGGSPSVEELQAGVLWIRAGGRAEALAQLRRSAANRSLAVPIAVSAELLARGWPPAEATETLERLFAAQLSDAGFLALRDQVDHATKRGTGLVPAVRTEVAKVAPLHRIP